jgi:tetratricopeptide (TPR) repeat protein
LTAVAEPGFVYTNPYYVAPAEPAVSGLDYSQPLAVPLADWSPSDGECADAPVPEDGSAVAAEPAPLAAASREALTNFAAAREAFKRGEYAEALELDGKAIRQMPGDAALHEFRGLTLFALKRYGAAAAAIHAVLATGPGWDWPTVSGLYAGPPTYTEQLRALEAHQRANPEDPAAAFLLAYHYVVIGRPEAAVVELERVVKLEPGDVLSARLLGSLRDQRSDGHAEQP